MIQLMNVRGALISLDQVSYSEPGGKEFKQRWYRPLKYKFYFKYFIRSKNFDLEKFSVKKSLFFPQGPPAFDVILF